MNFFYTLPFFFFFHHKWKEAWLLVTNVVYMSCLTSCLTTVGGVGGAASVFVAGGHWSVGWM